jgi:HAD superfamily hydrolase (TIGR01459 family)
VQLIRTLAELDGRYDAVLCDVWGVLHDGMAVFPGVAEALRGARDRGVAVVLLTNAPRPNSTLPAALARLGFPADAWDAIVTSGDAFRVELARRAPGPVHRLGRDTDAGLWDGLGLRFTDLAGARFLAMAGLTGAREQPEDYLGALRAARARDLELLCANPDRQVQNGDRLVWCAGAVADEYAELGGRVVQVGKPMAAIYARALEAVAGVAGRPVPKERVLAIGDGIGTDILGANRAGLDCLFIGTGLHGDTLLGADGALDPERAGALLSSAGVATTYGMARLA